MSKIVELLNGDTFNLAVLRQVHANLALALGSGNESVLNVIKQIASGNDKVFVYYKEIKANTVVVGKDVIALLHNYSWFPTNGGAVFPLAASIIQALIVVKDDESLLLLDIKDIVKDVDSI